MFWRSLFPKDPPADLDSPQEKAKLTKKVDRMDSEEGNEEAKNDDGTVQLMNGRALYLNWRYEGHEDELLSAKVDRKLVKDHLQELTNSQVEPFYAEDVKNRDELKKVVESFKTDITKNSAHLNVDYIIVAINAHGCNRTVILTDDMKPVDIFDDIIWELDHTKFPEFGKTKPRLYLVNACSDFSKEIHLALPNGVRPVKDGDCSPFFILYSTLPDASVSSHKINGSPFFRAICHRKHGFRKGVKLSQLIQDVQCGVTVAAQQQSCKQTMNQSSSTNFRSDLLAFGPHLTSTLRTPPPKEAAILRNVQVPKFPRNYGKPFWIKREKEVEKIRSALNKPCEKFSEVVVVVVGGIRGIGKSSLVLEYIESQKSESASYVNVIFIDCTNDATIMRSFGVVQQRLYIKPIPKPRDLTYTHLAKVKTLVVFQNAESPVSLQGYLPQEPHPNLHFIVTSELWKWDVSEQEMEIVHVRLQLLSRESAVKYVKEHLAAYKLSSEDEIVKQLVRRFGCHLRALECACQAIQAANCYCEDTDPAATCLNLVTLDSLLDTIEAEGTMEVVYAQDHLHPHELLYGPMNEPGSLRRLFDLTLHRATRDSVPYHQLTKDLFTISALGRPAKVSKNVFQFWKTQKKKGVNLENVVKHLFLLSLTYHDPNPCRLSVHPLIRDAFHDFMQRKKDGREKAKLADELNTVVSFYKLCDSSSSGLPDEKFVDTIRKNIEQYWADLILLKSLA